MALPARGSQPGQNRREPARRTPGLFTQPLIPAKPQELPVWDVMLAVAIPVAALAFGVIWWATLKLNYAPPSALRKPKEVSIGKFSCRNSALGQPTGATPTTAAVDCSISAVIEVGEVELIEMEDRLDQYRARLREVVEISIRHASVEETQDPDLTAMRQRLQEGFNSLLGDKAVKEVVINNWRAYTIPIFVP